MRKGCHSHIVKPQSLVSMEKSNHSNDMLFPKDNCLLSQGHVIIQQLNPKSMKN